MSRARSWVAALATVAVAACGGGDAAPDLGATISEDAFVATYIDLRVEALRSTAGTIDDEAKARILETNGVTEEELLEFVDTHGQRVGFMRDVWNRVDQGLSDLRVEEPDSIGP